MPEPETTQLVSEISDSELAWLRQALKDGAPRATSGVSRYIVERLVARLDAAEVALLQAEVALDYERVLTENCREHHG